MSALFVVLFAILRIHKIARFCGRSPEIALSVHEIAHFCGRPHCGQDHVARSAGSMGLCSARSHGPGRSMLQPPDQFVRIRVLHQRESEPLLAKVLDGRAD